MKRYTPKVEHGIKYAIAMLEIDAEHIENSVKHAIVLDEDAPKPKLNPQDKKQLEEYRAAAEWLRDLVESYQPRKKEGENDAFSAQSIIEPQGTVPPDVSLGAITAVGDVTRNVAVEPNS